jgi:hypothetical protein
MIRLERRQSTALEPLLPALESPPGPAVLPAAPVGPIGIAGGGAGALPAGCAAPPCAFGTPAGPDSVGLPDPQPIMNDEAINNTPPMNNLSI